MDSGGSSWGGPRQGAGRKREQVFRPRLKVPMQIWVILQERAKAEGTTPEVLAVRWIEERAMESTGSHGST